VQHLIVTYGYLGIVVLMLAEAACIPIPSEVAAQRWIPCGKRNPPNGSDGVA